MGNVHGGKDIIYNNHIDLKKIKQQNYNLTRRIQSEIPHFNTTKSYGCIYCRKNSRPMYKGKLCLYHYCYNYEYGDPLKISKKPKHRSFSFSSRSK